MLEEDAFERIVEIATRAPSLGLLVLFGSRGRGDAQAGSDWDLGYIGDATFDPDQMLSQLVAALGTDRIDVVDLARAGGLLRFRAARDGRPLFEAQPNAFAHFWLDAVSFWCDVAPLVERGYDAVLADLPR